MKYSVKYQVIRRKNSSKVCPLAARVTFAGQRVDLRLGVSIPFGVWNADRQMAASKSPREKVACAEANKAIQRAGERIEQLFVRCDMVEHRWPTVGELRDAVSPKGTATNISAILDMYLADNAHLEYNSVVAYQCSVRYFVMVEGDMQVGDISEAVMQDFCIKSLLEHANSTVRLRCVMMACILRWAKGKGHYHGDALNFNFKYKVSEKPVVHLSQQELITFYEYRPPYRFDRLVQLMYLFCCFTGLRYSDAVRLSWSQVHDTYFDLVTKKTNDRLKIELNNYSSGVLRMCREELVSDTAVFRRVDLSTYERSLRRMFQDLGFDEPVTIEYYRGNVRETVEKPKYQLLTSHTARKTFVVNALTLGVPVVVVMRWTGHKTLKAMAPYTKIVDEVKEAQMSKFNNLGNLAD